MPYYNYKCMDCEYITEIKASSAQKEAGIKVNCAKCESSKTTHVFGSISIPGKATSPVSPCGVPVEQTGGCGSCSSQ